MADVVKMTDPQLNLVLAEGGGEPGKNRFDEQTNESNLFLLSQDIERIILGSEPVLKMDYISNDKTRRGRKYV